MCIFLAAYKHSPVSSSWSLLAQGPPLAGDWHLRFLKLPGSAFPVFTPESLLSDHTWLSPSWRHLQCCCWGHCWPAWGQGTGHWPVFTFHLSPWPWPMLTILSFLKLTLPCFPDTLSLVLVLISLTVSSQCSLLTSLLLLTQYTSIYRRLLVASCTHVASMAEDPTLFLQLRLEPHACFLACSLGCSTGTLALGIIIPPSSLDVWNDLLHGPLLGESAFQCILSRGCSKSQTCHFIPLLSVFNGSRGL